MFRTRLAYIIGGGLFLYLFFWHFATFAAFWTPILAPVDPSGNSAAVLALLTPVIIAAGATFVLNKTR